jgi:hypothetical protein
MDLSIRVIALILCVTEVTSHQDTHTYRLSKFLKISAAPFRLIRQQQRNEIMKNFLTSVKRFSTLFSSTPLHFLSPPTAGNTRRCRRGAHYIDPITPVNTPQQN